MNKYISLSSQILLTILETKVCLKLAYKKVLSKNQLSRTERNGILRLVSSALRHYLIFDFLIQEHFDSVSLYQKCLLLIHLANKLYVKSLSISDTFDVVATSLIESGTIKNEVVLVEFENKTNNKDEIIPSDIDKHSPLYFSYLFNVPLWLSRMWIKQFSERIAYSVMRSNVRFGTTRLLVNQSMTSLEEVLNKYVDFIKDDHEQYVRIEHGVNISRHQAYLSRTVLNVPPSIYHVINKVDVDPLRGVALFSGCTNKIHLALLSRFGNNFKCDIVADNFATFSEINDDCKFYRMNNINTYEAKASSIITCLSKPVHTFFVIPNNSNFSKLKMFPDYFLFVEQNKLDEYLSHQNEVLNEAAPFVEEGGQLVYIVPTINKRESRSLIRRFLENHVEFELEVEMQIYPFTVYEDSLYYAVLKKVKKND